MHAISDNAVSHQSLAAQSIATYRAGETALSAASTTGRVLIRKEGAVTVVTEGVEIAKVTEPGAVFSEHSAWLGQPHTADVHALEESKLYVVSTAAPLMQNPVAVSCVATVVERREDSANRAQAELRRQVQDGQLSSITRKTIDKIEELLGASGGNLVYAGYPYDPFVLDT
jgi:CRP/FNR family transcriptional regulator, cyclic AMP receptor protein